MATILLIDDQPEILNNIAQILAFEGFSVLMATEGAEGAHLAQQQHPDLILCDMMMKGMNGRQLYQLLKSNAETAHIPFIFLTGGVNEGMVRGQHYLIKPVGVSELLQTVKEAIGR